MPNLFNKVSEKVSAVTKSTVQKTENTVKIAKLKFSVKTDKSRIDDYYKTIGSLTYETVKNGKDNSQLIDELIEKIKNLETHIEHIEKEISEMSQKAPKQDESETSEE